MMPTKGQQYAHNAPTPVCYHTVFQQVNEGCDRCTQRTQYDHYIMHNTKLIFIYQVARNPHL